MARVDFVQLAEYCTERYKGSIEINRGFKYVKTTYFGIFRDNSIHYSSTPHVLHDSHQCILIHEKAISLTYSSYKIEFINNEGCVVDSSFEQNYILFAESDQSGSFLLHLKYKDIDIYNSSDIQKVWILYSKIKDIQSDSERELVIDLFRKDERVFELEKQIEDFTYANHLLKLERDQYKELLDEIKETLNKE